MENSEAVTDPATLAWLNGEVEQEPVGALSEAVTDPATLAWLNEGAKKEAVEPASTDSTELPDHAMPYVSPWEYLKKVGSATEAGARGAVAGTLGVVGDVESLGRSLLADKDNQDTAIWTSKDVKKGVDFLFGEQTSSSISQEAIDAGQFIGNMAAPVGSIVKGGNAGLKALTKKAAAVQATKKALLDPTLKYGSELATVKLSSAGEVVKDVVGKKLVKLDTNPELVSYVTNTEKGNKPAMAEILQRIKNGVGNQYYTSAHPPTEAIGKSVVKRLETLTGLRKNYGAKLEAVVNTELKELSFKVSGLDEAFLAGVKKTFDTSLDTLEKLPKATQTNLKELSRLINNQGDKGVLSGKQMHALKRILDDLRDVGASDNMSRGVDSIVGGLRKHVNDELNLASNSYAGINSKLTSILSAETPFLKLDKTRQFASDAAFYNKVGQKFKNLGTGNSALSTEWMNALKGLDESLGGFGIRFKDDPVALSIFAKEATEFASINSATLFKYGDKQARQAVLKTAGSAAVNNTFGAMNNVANLVSVGVSKSNAKKALAANKKAYYMMINSLAK